MAAPTEPDFDELRHAAASGAERAELVEENDQRLIAQAQRLRSWLESTPELDAAGLELLVDIRERWTAAVEQRLDLLRRQVLVVAEMISALEGAPAARRADVLATQAAVLDATASTARMSVAVLTACAAIDERLRGDA